MNKDDIKHEFLVFLVTEPHIRKLDYSLLRYTINPDDYRYDLYKAIQRDDIEIRIEDGSGGSARASYDFGYDSFELPQDFSITRWRDQAFFIHECTHAIIDIKNIGDHSAHEDEAVAYVAEALFLESLKKDALSGHSIRTMAHKIAKDMLKTGKKKVADTDAEKLVNEVSMEEDYSTRVVYNSNKFDLGPIRWCLRWII